MSTREFAAEDGRPVEPSVADCFAHACHVHAAKIAVQDLHRTWTYAELGRRVAALRARIVPLTQSGEPIAILLGNDAHAVAAVVGVLTAGRAIVPLDLNHPLARLRTIMAHAGARVLISGHPHIDDARRLGGNSVTVVDIDEPHDATADEHVSIDTDALAWIAYTSGSTGKPKGVYQNHWGLAREVLSSVDAIGIRATDRQTLFYSLTMIAGVRAAIGCLLAGAELHILPPGVLGIDGLARDVRERKITLFRSTPTLFRHVASRLAPGERLEHVRRVYLGGDYVFWADYDLFRRVCRDDAEMDCHLGSTECTGVSMYWFVDPSKRRESSLLPVGYPARYFAVALHDDDGKEVHDGEIGEFVISSPILARGYWRDPELTASTFFHDESGKRAFRTGDLGRRHPDGLFEFVGRKDHQIKLHGHRVELGEIEAVLRECSGVREAAIVVRRNERGIARGLAAYVQLHDGVRGLLPRHLMGLLEQKLPPHMVPGKTYICDELPWLNFKIDRRSLEEIDGKRAIDIGTPDPLTEKIARVFEAVLDVTGATPDDSLASLGGDSLQAVDIMLRMEQEFGVRVPQRVFRSSRSIEDLGTWLKERIPAVHNAPSSAPAAAG